MMPKSRSLFGGEVTVITAPAPEPERLIVCGELIGSFAVIVSVPERRPIPCGVNMTVRSWVAPNGPSEHGLPVMHGETLKSLPSIPPTAAWMLSSVAVPWFATWALPFIEPPIAVGGKLRFVGETVMNGMPPLPLPDPLQVTDAEVMSPLLSLTNSAPAPLEPGVQ